MPYVSSQFPYYDDFDPSKGYHRVLFRPGRAVQARELTQLQTMLQNQVGTLGRHLFKEGSLAFPGDPPQYRGNLDYVKLEVSYNGVDADDVIGSIINKKLKNNSNVTATVVAAIPSENGDPPTVYISYERNADDGITKTFSSGDILTQYYSSSNNYLPNVQVQAIASNSTGQGSAVGLTENYIFIRDTFVKLTKELNIVDKYNRLTSNSVGFKIYEDIVTYADDSDLRDPAVRTEGSADSNYYALGADRYRIRIELESRSLLEDTTDVDPNFFEFIRIINGEASWVRDDIIYDVLNQELAKRTYEESGDYTVECFPLQIQEHSNSSNGRVVGYYTANGLSNAMVAVMGPGLAYVRGYRVESKGTQPVTIWKPRDYANVSATTVNIDTGNYVLVDGVYGLPNLVTDLEQVTLFDDYKSSLYATAGTGNRVGTARVRHFELFSGTPGQADAQYKMFLFDVNIDRGQSMRSVKSFRSSGADAIGFTANIVPNYVLLTGGVSTTNGSVVVLGTRSAFEFDLADPSDTTTFSDYIRVVAPQGTQDLKVAATYGNGNLELSAAATLTTTDAPFYAHTLEFKEQAKSSYLYKLPYDTIKTVDSNNTATTFTVKTFSTATLSANAATLTIGGSVNETWQSPTNEGSLLLVTSGARAGNIFPAVTFISRSANQKTLTIDMTGVSGVSSATVVVMNPKVKTLDKAARRTKSKNLNHTFDINASTTYDKTVIDLNRADGIRLVSVYESPAGSGSYTASGARDITSRYTFDNGQRPGYYGLAKIIRKQGSPAPIAPIRVTFDYFSHGGTGDYFSVDSYTDNSIDFDDIPTFQTLDGEVYLSDYIDARPVINQAGTGFSSTGAVKPDFFDLTNPFVTSMEYYLARNASVSMNNLGRFLVKYGASAPKGQARDPEPADDAMPLYIIRMQPYVRNVDKDVRIQNLCVQRYTMKDIGKLDRRITNLEYYTSLSLLEKQTESLQIKDQFGLDRFKNGFIVDNFTGFGVADPTSTTAIDFRSNELRPRFSRKSF